MTALAITLAPDKTTAIRNCLRYDPNFLSQVFIGYFCDTIDAESVGSFFAEHTDWASLYLAFSETIPEGIGYPSAEELAPVAAFPAEMLAYISQYGDVYEPTVLNLASLPLIAPQGESSLPDNMWLLYDNVDQTSIVLGIVTAPDKQTAHLRCAEAVLASREYLAGIAIGEPWLVSRPADIVPSSRRVVRVVNGRAFFFSTSELHSFLADHADWEDLYMAHYTAGDLSAEVVASFPRDMLLHIYEEDCGRWRFEIDLSTIPFTRE